VPVLVVATEAERDALQARDLRRGDGDPFALVIVLWSELPILLQAAWTDPTLPCPPERVRWYGRTLYIAGFDPSAIQRTELLVDAQALGVDLQQCAALPEGASDATIVAWLLDALPPISLEEMIAQAQAAVTPEGEAAQVLVDLATVPEGERLATLLSEEVLCLLDVVQHTPLWLTWKQQAKKLCPALNLTGLGSILTRRRKDREEALKQTRKKQAAAQPKTSTNGHAPPTGPAERWQQYLQLTSQGTIKANIPNYMEILTHHPEWEGRLTWDAFRHHLCLDGSRFEDVLMAKVAHQLGITLGIDITNTKPLREALGGVASEHQVDPLRDSIKALPAWDEESRLGTWLHTYAGAAHTDYHSWVGSTIIAGMLSRALDPGCIMRYVLILEGQEGTGKSELVAALGGAFASTMHVSLEAKEAQMRLKGIWVMELPELDAMSRSEQPRIKAFISTTTDTYVMKYANDPTSYARRTIFIGTTNEPMYLGPYENTRFLPVETTTIDVKGFKAERDQILAEGLAYLKANPEWWVIPPDLEDEVLSQRRQRTKPATYGYELATWLRKQQQADGSYLVSIAGDPDHPRYERTVASNEAILGALGISDQRDYRALQMDMAMAFKEVGWTHKRIYNKYLDKLFWRWEPPKTAPDATETIQPI
jgi:hypothetical protein